MDTVKEIARTLSIRIFAIVALLGAVVALFPFPPLGVLIAVLTVLSLYVQGSEALRAKKELEKQHTSVLQEIEEARKAAASQHVQALKEIQQARMETSTRHAEALQEIEEARKDAARQYEEAAQEIKKAHAERFLLQAEKLATSLKEKDELVNKAVALYPDFRQRELRQSGIEMSQAVLGNVDHLQEKSMRAMRHHDETVLLQRRLEPDDRTYFIEHALSYLEETVLRSTDEDVVGLVYLACMYGCTQRYDDLMLVLEKARQIRPIMQVMEDEYRVRPMLFLLVDACCSDQTKIERLRETLALPKPTEQYFGNYMTHEYFLNPKSRTSYSEWVAVRKPDVPGEKEMGSAVLKICAPYPPERTTYAFFGYHDGTTETIVSADQKVAVEDLFSKLRDLCILFCPLD